MTTYRGQQDLEHVSGPIGRVLEELAKKSQERSKQGQERRDVGVLVPRRVEEPQQFRRRA